MKKILCSLLAVVSVLQLLACGSYTVTIPDNYMDYIPDDVKGVAGSLLEDAIENEQIRLTFGPASILKDEQTGGVQILASVDEFKKAGFLEGDSVDITFSNGYRLLSVPFYSVLYANWDYPVLSSLSEKNALICSLSDASVWEKAGLKEGDKAAIELSGVGKYAATENVFHLSIEKERLIGCSDEAYANFRSLNAGILKENLLYRSASPFNDTNGRVKSVDALVEMVGIQYIINLSDTKEELDAYIQNEIVSDYCRKIILSEHCFTDKLENPLSEEYGKKVATALQSMLKADGPILIHGLNGIQRTGFVCALLETLCGASYEEMLSDYMKSYENYFGITKESSPDLYQAVFEVYFLPYAETVADSYSVENYLIKAGMLPGEIEALKVKFSK